MTNYSFDYKHALTFFCEKDIYAMQNKVEEIHNELHKRSATENDYKGWVDLPKNYDKKEFKRIEQTAKKIQSNSEILLVIGVGGSYLGSKAAIDMLQHNFYDLFSDQKKQNPQIIFVGHTLSTQYIVHVKEILKSKDFSINVISKSGTTTEPAISFRIFKEILYERYGKEEAKNRLFITTDESKGPLLEFARQEDYETFTIPADVGGRYSVLTAVGLLPIAVSGVNINEMMKGAREAYDNLNTKSLLENDSYQYAVTRYLLYNQGKTIELLVNYEPNMESFSKWWQQLFGESEGKNNQGIYPSFVNFPTDLHAIGQYIQDGRRDLFETTIRVSQLDSEEVIQHDEKNIDELNYLAGKSLEEVNEKVHQAAVLAHTDGDVPNLIMHVPALDAYTFGYLVYFFQKACAMSGNLFEVNPFNQPGVEAYKNNMHALLGKPGFEKRQQELEEIFKTDTLK